LAAWFNLAASKLLFKQQFAKLPVDSDIEQIEYAKLPAGTDIEQGEGRALQSTPESTTLERESSGNTEKSKGNENSSPLMPQMAEIPVFYTAPKHDYLIMGMLFLWLGVMAVIGYTKSFSNDTRILIVGIVTNANLLFFYGAPLSTISTILANRNTATIHVPTMLTNTISSVFWGVYGLAILDLFICIPNCIGAVLGFMQIALYLVFPREETVIVPVITAAAPNPDGEGDDPGVVQLQLHEINLDGMTINIPENTVTQTPAGPENTIVQIDPVPDTKENIVGSMDASNRTEVETERHPLTVNFAEDNNTNVVTATSVVHRRLPSQSMDHTLTMAFATLPEAFGFGGPSDRNLVGGHHRRLSSLGRGHDSTLQGNIIDEGVPLTEADLPTEANTRHRRVLSTGGVGAGHRRAGSSGGAGAGHRRMFSNGSSGGASTSHRRVLSNGSNGGWFGDSAPPK